MRSEPDFRVPLLQQAVSGTRRLPRTHTICSSEDHLVRPACNCCALQGRSWTTWSACWEETTRPAPARPSPPTTRCPSPGRPVWRPGARPRAPTPPPPPPQVQPIGSHVCHVKGWPAMATLKFPVSGQKSGLWVLLFYTPAVTTILVCLLDGHFIPTLPSAHTVFLFII